MQPISKPTYATLRSATWETAISRSQLYRLMAAGKIRAVKSGRTTLVDMETLREHLASLPVLQVGPSNQTVSEKQV